MHHSYWPISCEYQSEADDKYIYSVHIHLRLKTLVTKDRHHPTTFLVAHSVVFAAGWLFMLKLVQMSGFTWAAFLHLFILSKQHQWNVWYETKLRNNIQYRQYEQQKYLVKPFIVNTYYEHLEYVNIWRTQREHLLWTYFPGPISTFHIMNDLWDVKTPKCERFWPGLKMFTTSGFHRISYLVPFYTSSEKKDDR